MAEPSTHINYQVEDIQRYLQGKMSAAEMHSIEKAALQDPFLADAIEGYNKIDIVTAKQHLNEINASLFSEKKKNSVVLISRKTQWLRIAALIVILAGVGITAIYIFKNTARLQQIAQVKKEATNNVLLVDSANLKSDTSSSAMQEKTMLVKNEKRQKPLSPASLKKENNTVAISPDKSLQADETSTTANISAAPIQQNEDASNSLVAASSSNKEIDSLQGILEGKTNGINTSANTFTGKIRDENGNPVAGAVIESADKKVVVTDMNGSFVVQKNDSVLNVTASTGGYEKANAALQPGVENLIMLKQNSTALNEAVITTAYGTNKKRTVSATPTPVGGWENFNNYVVSELNKDSTKENFISKKYLVEMEFLIDNSGNPYNIKIVKPLDDKRNSKAIEILKTGPKWTNTANNKKARVAISF